MSAHPDPDEELRDRELCERAVAGDLEALEILVRRHQRFVYNVSLRLVLRPQDAEDLSQEALIRVVTRLDQYEGRSAFRTWMYTIIMRCFLDSRRGKMERAIQDFEEYGDELDALPMGPMRPAQPIDPERALLIEEAKVGCMMGMLLCLDREQRVVYVLGDVFELPGATAAAILELTPSTYRKRLERARRNLISFMERKCGLIATENPCRCSRKTQAFLEQGWVDPVTMQFTSPHLTRAKRRAATLTHTLEAQYAALFRAHPEHLGPDLAERVRDALAMQEGS